MGRSSFPEVDVDIPEGFSQPGSAVSPVTLVQPVVWGELDAYNHVNNAVFLRWFENVRFHYFELTGVTALYHVEKKGPILARAEIDFLAPVSFPDDVWLSMRVSKIGNTSFVMENLVWSAAQEKLVARGTNVGVMLDYETGAKIRVPEPIRAAIRALEGPDVEG